MRNVELYANSPPLMNFLQLRNIFISHALITHNFLNANESSNICIRDSTCQTEHVHWICRPLTFVPVFVRQFVIYANSLGPSAKVEREEKWIPLRHKGIEKIDILPRNILLSGEAQLCIQPSNSILSVFCRPEIKFLNGVLKRTAIHSRKQKISTES